MSPYPTEMNRSWYGPAFTLRRWNFQTNLMTGEIFGKPRITSWNPQIVNNDEDAGLQTVIIGDIFSVFMICIYYNWLWSRLGRIWRNTV